MFEKPKNKRKPGSRHAMIGIIGSCLLIGILLLLLLNWGSWSRIEVETTTGAKCSPGVQHQNVEEVEGYVRYQLEARGECPVNVLSFSGIRYDEPFGVIAFNTGSVKPVTLVYEVSNSDFATGLDPFYNHLITFRRFGGYEDGEMPLIWLERWEEGLNQTGSAKVDLFLIELEYPLTEPIFDPYSDDPVGLLCAHTEGAIAGYCQE